LLAPGKCPLLVEAAEASDSAPLSAPLLLLLLLRRRRPALRGVALLLPMACSPSARLTSPDLQTLSGQKRKSNRRKEFCCSQDSPGAVCTCSPPAPSNPLARSCALAASSMWFSSSMASFDGVASRNVILPRAASNLSLNHFSAFSAFARLAPVVAPPVPVAPIIPASTVRAHRRPSASLDPPTRPNSSSRLASVAPTASSTSFFATLPRSTISAISTFATSVFNSRLVLVAPTRGVLLPPATLLGTESSASSCMRWVSSFTNSTTATLRFAVTWSRVPAPPRYALIFRTISCPLSSVDALAPPGICCWCLPCNCVCKAVTCPCMACTCWFRAATCCCSPSFGLSCCSEGGCCCCCCFCCCHCC
jgi:hypothetical protein